MSLGLGSRNTGTFQARQAISQNATRMTPTSAGARMDTAVSDWIRGRMPLL